MGILRNAFPFSQEWLQTQVVYRDGNLYWMVSGSGRKLHTSVGVVNGPYIEACIAGTRTKLHRLIWYYFTGEQPDYIDHINRNGLDNRIENLRVSDPVRNRFNSSIAGVCYRKTRGKYRAYISVSGKRIELGAYATREDAEAARKSIATEWFGHSE